MTSGEYWPLNEHFDVCEAGQNGPVRQVNVLCCARSVQVCCFWLGVWELCFLCLFRLRNKSHFCAGTGALMRRHAWLIEATPNPSVSGAHRFPRLPKGPSSAMMGVSTKTRLWFLCVCVWEKDEKYLWKQSLVAWWLMCFHASICSVHILLQGIQILEVWQSPHEERTWLPQVHPEGLHGL